MPTETRTSPSVTPPFSRFARGTQAWVMEAGCWIRESTHPKVERVFYPGLESSPFHALARRQMKDFGGMVSFEIRGGVDAGRRLMDNIRIFTLAVSLGCVDSLIQHPASMTHACVPRAKREKGGVTDGLVRISVGLEDADDLLQALDDGLAKA